MAVVFKDRVSQRPNRYKVIPDNGNPYYVTLERADEPTEVGTPLSAVNMNALVPRDEAEATYLKRAGDNATGAIGATGAIRVTNPDWPTLEFKSDDNTGTGSVYQAQSSRRLGFRQYAAGSTSSEDYQFPPPDKTDTRKWYNILTTKSPVGVANGGTGGTTALDAATNLLVATLANVAGEKDLEAGTDLNTITAGTCRSPSAAISPTLVNAPPITNAGFRLITSHVTTAASFIQVAIYYQSEPTIYVRTKSTTWGAWKKLTLS